MLRGQRKIIIVFSMIIGIVVFSARALLRKKSIVKDTSISVKNTTKNLDIGIDKKEKDIYELLNDYKVHFNIMKLNVM